MDFRGRPEIINREYGLSGTEPVINPECMEVHAKVDVNYVKLSGTAIIKFLLPSQADCLRRFCYYYGKNQVSNKNFI